MPERILVVGQGYVGLPLAIRAADVGFDVVGVEADPYRFDCLARGVSYVDDVPGEAVAAAKAAGRYRCLPGVEYASGFDVAVIAVATPLVNGAPDLGQVTAASAALAKLLTPGATVVLESTTYPGTTEEVVAPVLEAGSGLSRGTDFCLGYSPERIDPGNDRWRLETIPKLVSGVDQRSLDRIRQFYARIVSRVVPVGGVREAEFAKLIENVYRNVNIALVNELAVLAHGLGIDVWDALDAAATKPFGYLPFRPGAGVGGHCLPVDPRYLSWRTTSALGRVARCIEVATEINDGMPGYVVDRLVDGLRRRGVRPAGGRVLVVGAAYKANMSDTREAPAGKVCALLMERGAEVAVVDPHVAPDAFPAGTTRVTLTKQVVAESDAVLIVVAHERVDFTVISANARYILDCCRCVSGSNVERL